MTARSRWPHRRPAFAPAAGALLVLALALGLGGHPPAGAALAQGGGIQLLAPARVAVGAPIEVTLVAQSPDLAGYEAALLFDARAVVFDGLGQRQNDLKRLGREVAPLGAVAAPDGVRFGLYSCPADDCAARNGRPNRAGAGGRVRLASAVLHADRPGTVELTLADVRLVDATGTGATEVPPQTVRVQVGPGGGETHPAPPLSGPRVAPLRPRRVPSQPVDVTRDGRADNADALELAVAWTDARERGLACGAGIDPRFDPNGDGCLDVADLQLAAAQPAAPTPTAASAAGPAVQANASPGPLTFAVNSAADTADAGVGNGVCATAGGVCTLRAALQEANAHVGPDTIVFNIPGGGTHTIQLGSQLPSLSDATGGTTINGYTQPGASPNTSAAVSTAAIRIQVAGQGAAAFDGLLVTSGGNVVRGVALYNFRRHVYLFGRSATNNVLAGAFVGTNAAGTFRAPAATLNADAVSLRQGAAHNRIGGSAPADRDVLSGGPWKGVNADHEGTTHNVVQGNLIGLTPRGTARLGNARHGVDLNARSSYNLIGGTAPGERNVISGNDGEGVEISHDSLTVQNRVLGNYIGTDVSGTTGPAYARNAEQGLRFEDGVSNNLAANNVIGNNGFGGVKFNGFNLVGNRLTNNRIGVGVTGNPIPNVSYGVQVTEDGARALIGPGNVIAFNPVGIRIDRANGLYNTISRNSIYGNGGAAGLGIDLAPLGQPNPNDAGDADTGPNQLLNYPVLTRTSTRAAGGATSCSAANAATVPGPCTVEVFVADRGAGAHGQGKAFAGAGSTKADGSFSVALSGVQNGNYLTATLTDAQGNTSEFSLNVVVPSRT